MKSLYFTLILSLFVVLAFPKAYDSNLAYQLLRASSASYCANSKLGGMKCGAICNSMKGVSFHHQFTHSLNSKESVSYSSFVDTPQKRIIFAFRGTQGNIQLIKEVAQGKAVSYSLHHITKNAVVTDYFFTKYKNFLRSDFLNKARTLLAAHPGFHLYITGHSLGGAFATHAALDVAFLNIVSKDRIHLYTFGSPRVGDYNFAEAVNNRVGESFRVVHGKDIVPHVPPCITDFKGGCTAYPNHPNQNGFIIWNAYHVGTEVFYDQANASAYRICSKSEDSTCSKKYNLLQLGTNDHLTYLGVSTSC